MILSDIKRYPLLFLAVSLLCFFASLAQSQQTSQGRGTVRMSLVAVNPSETKEQTVSVKTYLPSEVTPNDILNSGGLKIEFDTGSSTYYLFSDDLKLQPKESRTFQLELRDVWIIPKERLAALRSQTEALIKHMEGSEDYEMAKNLGEAINKSLETVEQTQNDESLSTKNHIGVYRNNLKIIEQIKEDIVRLDKQNTLTGNPPVPEILENSNLNTTIPAKSTTWMIIIIIMVFMGMLAGVFFLTWSTQAHFTKNAISETRNSVFPKNNDLLHQDVKKEKIT